MSMSRSIVIAAVSLVLGGGVLAAPSSARAEDPALGVYEVKYDEVANSCTQVGMSMMRGTVTLKMKKGKLVVDIERIPTLRGKPPAKDGKINTQSALGPSTIEGLDGKFSAIGRASDGVLELLFVAEYFHKRKPYCTQSWNVSGLKQSELEKKKP
jgi:hypothetical protein